MLIIIFIKIKFEEALSRTALRFDTSHLNKEIKWVWIILHLSLSAFRSQDFFGQLRRWVYPGSEYCEGFEPPWFLIKSLHLPFGLKFFNKGCD